MYLPLVVGFSLWRRVWLTPDYLLLALAPLALVSGRLIRFLAEWVPLVALLLAWEAMRGIAPLLDMPVHHGGYGLEMWLFQGRLPTVVLQDWLHQGQFGRAVDYLTSVVYVLHFGVTLGIGMLLWTVSRRHFFRYSAVLLTLSMASFVIFLIVPTAPPWWASDHNFLKGMDHILLDTLPTSMSPYYQSLNPNPVAALPSLHSAFPMIGFLALRQVWPRLAFVALAWCALVWFSVVYLGEHYVVDVAVGVALGTACWFLVDRFGDRLLASLSAGLEPLRLRLGSPLQGSE